MKKIFSSEKQEARKQQIVDAAIKCFIEKGYNQTGVRDIASTADVSLGNLYNYFKGKEAIIEQIAAYDALGLEPFVEQLASEGDRERIFDEFLRSYFDYSCLPENSLLGIEIIGEAVRNPKIAKIFEKNRRRLIHALSEFLQSGCDLDLFRKFDCSLEASRMILDLIEGRALRFSFTTQVNRKKSDIEFFHFVKSAIGACPTIDN